VRARPRASRDRARRQHFYASFASPVADLTPPAPLAYPPCSKSVPCPSSSETSTHWRPPLIRARRGRRRAPRSSASSAATAASPSTRSVIWRYKWGLGSVLEGIRRQPVTPYRRTDSDCIEAKKWTHCHKICGTPKATAVSERIRSVINLINQKHQCATPQIHLLISQQQNVGLSNH